MDNQQHYLPWVAIWGVVFGFLNGMPVLCGCCLLWFPLAGLLAVMNVANKAANTISFAEGAVIGLIAGGIAGVLSGILSGAFAATMGTAIVDWARSVPTFTPQQVAQIEQGYGNPAVSFLGLGCTFAVVGPALGAIGGLIGSAVFKKGPSSGPVPQPQAY